ncbi:hypothetical protein M3C74_10565 [Micrococcus lylae]|uniref:hypothetical protein n=1 Tax=Micrococcus lylae TaxID=1273 RepID=UPI0021A95A59|nr:hypothetical protein [Micrococcus lylae]MCT2008349.1 hypothetical protein [Micrococcus lylae]MCT2072261.1 hypothetical protein [Micrococcus lylae]
MQLFLLTSLFGVAVSIAVVYAVIRLFTNSAQRDPLQAARSHGMVTALIALFAATGSGLTSLVFLEDPPWAAGASDAPAGPGAFPVSAVPFDVGFNALAPVLWLPVVYWIAQRTWPTPVAPTRSARLTARSWREYLPPRLTIVTGVVALVSVAAALMLLPTDGRPLTTADTGVSGPDGMSETFVRDPGVRSGALVTPWLLGFVLLACLCGALAVAAVVRRRSLSGLTPAQDDAVRHVAVNRILRTLTVVLLSVPVAVDNAFGSQEPNRMGPFTVWSLAAVFAVALAMLVWTSPQVRVLRQDAAHHVYEDATGERVEVPRGPGTLSDVIQLRHTAAAVVLPFAAVALLAQFVLPMQASLEGSAVGSPVLFVLAAFAPLSVLWVGYLLAEFVLRMKHTDRTATARTRGVRASTWRVVLFGVVATAGLVAVGWAVREERALARVGVDAVPLAVAMLSALLVIGVLTAIGVRVCLRRHPLTRTSALMDRRMRRRTADRMVGIGTTGMLMVLATAVGQLVMSMSVAPLLYLLAVIPALLPSTSLVRPIGDAQDPADGSDGPEDGGHRPSSGRPEATGGPVAAGAKARR